MPPSSPTLLALGLALGVTVSTHATVGGARVDCPDGATVRVQRGLVYGPHPAHRADLYLPARGSPLPSGAVVILHGGGWDDPLQRRGAVAPTALRLACELGVPVLAPDYRLVREGGAFPVNVGDVTRALGWLRARSYALSVAPERVALVGESAGGHLALLASLPRRVAAVVSYSGATDLPRLVATASRATSPEVSGTVRALTGSRCDGREGDPCVAASPARRACSLPRVLLVHGARDHLVPIDQARGLADAVARCGGARAALWELPDEARRRCPPGLSEHGLSPCIFEPSWPSVRAFLREVLR